MRNNENNIIFNVRNITLNLKNITTYFTGKEKIITLVSVIIMLSFVNIINTSALSLSYQNSVGVGFTFNPTLSVNISPSNLTIDNLTPGTTSDSNIINISVATNAAYGYTLSAMMNGGNSNLTQTNGINIFSSITTDSSLPSLVTDNTWGYSYKDNTVQTPAWSSYSGLSNGTSKTLLDTDTNNTETGIDSIGFKIGAKAANTQASGTYTGTINFTAITKLKPKEISDLEYMQDFAALNEADLTDVKSSMPTHSVFTLKDKRDGQEYTIAKLADGKIWMTKSLNLAGGAEITSELSDIPEDYTLPTTDGFQGENKLPESSQNGFSTNNIAYLYNSNIYTNVCTNPGCYSYYSWTVATAGSGTNISTDNTDAPYSICPKGWKLPTSRSYTSEDSDFYKLIISYGANPDNVNDDSADTGKKFYINAGANTAPNFILSGGYITNSFGSYNNGLFWSSTSQIKSIRAYNLYITNSLSYSADNSHNRRGYAIRCLVR